MNIELLTLQKPIMMPDGFVYEFIAGYWHTGDQEEATKYGRTSYILGFKDNENDIKCAISLGNVLGIVKITQEEYDKLDNEICHKIV